MALPYWYSSDVTFEFSTEDVACNVPWILQDDCLVQTASVLELLEFERHPRFSVCYKEENCCATQEDALANRPKLSKNRDLSARPAAYK
jgi:hypothetical protein